MVPYPFPGRAGRDWLSRMPNQFITGFVTVILMGVGMIGAYSLYQHEFTLAEYVTAGMRHEGSATRMAREI